MKRALRVAGWTVGIAALIALAGLIGAWQVLQSDWFKTRVRQAIVAQIEQATGGTAAIDGYGFAWRQLRAEVRGLVVHGLEPAQAAPLFRAGRVTIGLRILPGWRSRADIRFLEIDEPAVNLLVNADGRTNIPEPRQRSAKAPLDRLIDLAVGEYRVTRGQFNWNDRRTPFEAVGRDLELQLIYQRQERAYQGGLAAKAVRVAAPVRTPVAVDVTAKWRLDRRRLDVKELTLAAAGLKAAARWVVTELDRAPRVEGTGEASLAVAEAGRLIELPVDPAGVAHWEGRFQMDAGRRLTAAGNVTAKGLNWKNGQARVRDIAGEARWELGPGGLQFNQVVARALGGVFRGQAQLTDWRKLRVQGQLNGFALKRLAIAARLGEPGFAASIGGTIEAELPAARVAANLVLTPEQRIGPGEQALSGNVQARYDRASGALEFGASALEWATSRVHFAGRLADRIEVGVITKDLEDFAPVLELAGARIETWPARLDRGVAQFDGTVTGALAEPVVNGRLEAGPLAAGGQAIEKVAARIEARRGQARVAGLEAVWNGSRIGGDLEAQLADWKIEDASAINGRIEVSKARLAMLLRQAGSSVAADGLVTATASLNGAYGAPRAVVKVAVEKLEAWQERFDHAEAEVRYSPQRIVVVNGRLNNGAGLARFSGTLEANTDAVFEAAVSNWRLAQWRFVERLHAKLGGVLGAKFTGSARRAGGQVQLTGLNGEAQITQMTVDKRPVGDSKILAATRGRTMAVKMDARLRNSRVEAEAEWNLGGKSFGLGQVRFPKLVFADLHDMGFLGDPNKELAFRGEAEGEVGFTGPVLEPEKWAGLAKITRLEVEPVRQLAAAQRAGPAQLVLRNRAPLTAHVNAQRLALETVNLVAEGTDLEMTGSVDFKSRNPWNLQIKGTLSLPALSTFEPDLVATGVSRIDASVRGSYDRPQLQGRMEVRNASFRLRDVPNGLTRANGVIVFDRTRANIESFTAQTGGGDLRLSGFVGLAEPELLYRLQATVEKVRVRYPEAVSTTFDATVNLTGTATQSLLSGTVNVTRMALNPQTDIGGLLQASSRSRQAPLQSSFLRGIQLDLRVETAPDAELQTSLTRDLQPQADLRVRGSLGKPVLLGRTSVEQGEINFFGNRYTITRGEVSFFNTAKIEPVLDLDLETRVRGITVTINFTGPIDKLAVSYRSDPPLQSSEIVALLTVGRTPGSSVTPNIPTRNQSVAQSSGESLLGQAISQPITGRLEKLFGVSRIKIDPDLTSVTNTAQARLTVEQQLSRDITITYITNLNRTEQQIVRLQWDFSKDFSILAIRDENGIFGVDFLWRKRF